MREHAVIIASEWFSFGSAETFHIERLRDALSGFQVHIVVVLRDVVDFANSLYAQRVRDGYPGTFENFFLDTFPLLNWSALCQRWADYFGANNVIALKFENMQREGLLSSFLKHTLQVDPGFPEPSHKNRALPRLAIDLMREVNELDDVSERPSIALKNAIKHYFDETLISYPKANYVCDAFAAILRAQCAWPHIVN